jgi:sensor histidine kinase YesM
VLLLQPIVENAVVHGLDVGQESLNVRVDAVSTTDGVAITVENDGASISAEPRRVGGHGVGLASTRARLMTVHGDRASLTLASRAGGGAIVRIVIPRKIAEGTTGNVEPALQGAAE